MKKFFFLIALIFAHSSCQNDQQKAVNGDEGLFTLLSGDQTGVNFENTLNDDPMGVWNILSYHHYYNGGGVAIGDINNDGLPDIFLSANEGPNRLYLNKGNFQFEDITESSRINESGKNWSVGATMADVNGDGWLDIYVCQAGYTLYPDRKDRENLLLINNQDGTFTEMAAEYGINDDNESTSAAFFDYDGDGDLDLYVLNESIYALMVFEDVFQDLKDKKKLEQASGNLYRNDGGKFTKVTEEAGVLRYGYGLGLVVNDLNGDGLPDIYVANDYSVPDFMFINNGDGTFTDSIKQKTKQISFFGMGCDVADINNDGFPDIGVVDMAANDHFRDKTLMESMDVEGFWYFVNTLGYQYQYMFNSLQLNNGNGTFSNIAALAGLLRSDWSWAALFADFNHDGNKDYYVTNGFRRYARDNDFRNEMAAIRNANEGTVPLDMREELYAKMPEIKDPNFMYRNNGDLTFSLVTKEWNLEYPSYSNGCAYVDLDGDGDLDLVVNNIDGPAFIFRNNSVEQNRGNYLIFDFEGRHPGDPVVNTKVRVYYGDEMQYQEFHPTRGYASSMGHQVHFGLKDIATVDSVVVAWQGGWSQVLEDVKTNQRITLKKGNAEKGIKRSSLQTKLAIASVDASEIGLTYSHKENEFNDFAREILLPHKQSRQGPALAIGDVNGDGLDDFYVGGAMNQSGVLYIQKANGKFEPAEQQPWEIHLGSEDIAAHFYDADNDGDLDLYVVSGGGGEYEPGSPFLQDRVYINFGEKGFAGVNALPAMTESGTVVRSADITGDGFPDLFVGGGAIAGQYPFPSRSYLLTFSNNKYEDVTEEIAPDLVKPGMVKDAQFGDINNDGLIDLVVVGEWMGVKIFINEGGTFRDASEEYGTSDLLGWWYSVAIADLNGDGLNDLVVGNLGLNTKFSASQEKPFNVFANDFDKNGTIDIVLSKEYDGRLVPARGKECSSEQMPFIDNKFPTYSQFANANLEDILGKRNLEEALHLQVKTFESLILINEGGHFSASPLPKLAQVAPINRIIVKDFNQDGNPDLLIAGNMHEAEVETPRYDAGTGLFLLGDGKGGFEAQPVWKTGFYAAKNVKDIGLVKTIEGMLILAANNDAPLTVHSFQGLNE
jgi:enediyne biosynthesis protein E4